jgi:hypothetical protein
MKRLLQFLRKYFTIIPREKKLDPPFMDSPKGIAVGIKIKL